MGKRQRLGQHTLTDLTILRRIVQLAKVHSIHSVLEIGTGSGNLTEELALRAHKVVAYEIDPYLYQQARQRLKRYTNLQLRNQDAFKAKPRFDLLVSNLPYSRSTRFIEWLTQQSFQRALVTLQSEFVLKLLTKPGTKHYRASTVLAQSRFRIKPLLRIPPQSFTPQPKVDSILVQIVPKGRGKLNPVVIRVVKMLHSFRGRTVRAALKHLSTQFRRPFKVQSALSNMRIEQLTPRQTLQIARHLTRRLAHP